MWGRIYSFIGFLNRWISANGTRSYSFLNVRFLTAADAKQFFPDCILNEGESETHSVPALVEGEKAFLLEGADDGTESFLRAHELKFDAPFSMRFRAGEKLKLFATSGCLLVRDAERGSFFICPEPRSSGKMNAVFRSTARESVESVVALSSFNWCSFGDFGLLMLPKFTRISPHGRTGQVMIPGDASYVAQYLSLFQLLPLAPERFSRELVPVRESAEVIFGPGRGEGFVPTRADLDRLRERVLPRLQTSGGRKLYFRRGGRRKITNEEELFPLFQRLGIEVIEDDHTDVMAQAALFRDADLILSPHGALLVNLMYCRPGTACVELLPGTYAGTCFRYLCHLVGISYHGVVCTRLAHFRNEAVTEDFRVDAVQFGKVLEKILSRLSPPA
jgi:hypothetical protein